MDATDTFLLDDVLCPPAGDAVKEHLSSLNAQLAYQNGKVVLLFTGFVRDERPIPFSVMPDHGALSKKLKWAMLTDGQRLGLVRQAVTKDTFTSLQSRLQHELDDAKDRLRSVGCNVLSRELLATLNPAHRLSVTKTLEGFHKALDAAMKRARERGMAQLTKGAVTLADYPATYVQAASMTRKFIALLGEPNSGKTHAAIEALATARNGVYLAPLRLLALENYERLTDRGVMVSLVTGEECRLTEGATHVASTIEMLNYQRRVEVAVIDEVQLLDDSDRGSAWTAAVVGVPADTVYLVGSLSAKEAVKSLAARLGCELEIRELHRKTPLMVETRPVSSLRQVRKGDAIIAFSRRDVLYWRDEITNAGFSVATIYGNLSPEVRRAQAALFREGKVDVLVGTDALGMGLNLPISRVIFSTTEKFDGTEANELPAWLVQQIGGRAGRYGIQDVGYVAGWGEDNHTAVKHLMKEALEPTRTRGFFVAPTLEHLTAISNATGETRLASLLKQFGQNIDTADGFFIPANLLEQMDRAYHLDQLLLTLQEKFLLSLLPISTKAALLEEAYTQWCKAMSAKKVTYLGTPAVIKDAPQLQTLEDACKMYSAYAWLGYRCPELFPDVEKALRLVKEVSEQIDQQLRKQNQKRARKAPEGRRKTKRS